MNLCVDACRSLGEGFAQWVFVAAAFAWGAYNKRRLAATKAENAQLRASLRPPPLAPVVHLQGVQEAVRYASMFPPKSSIPSPDLYVPDTSPETPTAKERGAP